MSDDLISKKALVDEISYKFGLGDSIVSNVINIIKRHKTAYDMGKVINMLKERAEHAESKAAEYDEKGNISMMDIWDVEAKSYRNAIEIVKSGGIADE